MASDGRLFWVRARWLLEQLRGRVRVTAPRLAKHFEISDPTARRVINSLRDDFDAPIEYDESRSSWVLEDPHFDLPLLPLSVAEVGSLALARSLFAGVSTPALATAFESFWGKIEDQVLARSPAGSALTRSLTAMLPSLSNVPAGTIDAVLRALALQRCLRLAYRSPWKDERSDRVVEPLRLVLYDGTYYLIAHCRLRGELRNFNLAAVEQITLLDEPAPTPDEDRVERYLASGWGAFRGRRVVTAAIRVEPPESRLLATQIWHAAQRDHFTRDGALIRRLPVSGLPELKRRVLSLGASATVLEPAELRDAVAAEVRLMAANVGRPGVPSVLGGIANVRAARQAPTAQSIGHGARQRRSEYGLGGGEGPHAKGRG